MRRSVVLVMAVAAWLAAGELKGQVYFGPQVGLGSDSDLGVGARVTFPLRADVLGADGAIDANYFFGGRGIDSWIDANANVRLPIPLARDFDTRLGVGLNLTYVSADVPAGLRSDSETDVGFNLLGLVEFPGRTTPFAELRAILGGGEQVVLTAGIVFGPQRVSER